MVKDKPTQHIGDYVQELQQNGYDCHREFVRMIFKSWRWSWKRPSYKQLQKYTTRNLQLYDAYEAWIKQQDLSKIKFVDEVHFVSKGKEVLF
jgi:hypothetical protein